MMPVIVSMLVFSLMALSRLWPDVRPRDWSAVIIVGLVLEIAFQSATLVQWERIVARGPVEERVIAALTGLTSSSMCWSMTRASADPARPASLRAYVKNCLGGVSSATLRELSGAITTGTPLLKADYYCDGQTGTALTPEEYDVRVPAPARQSGGRQLLRGGHLAALALRRVRPQVLNQLAGGAVTTLQ